MGFTPPKTIYRLDFTGTELEGLEVRIRGGRLRQAFSTIQLVGVNETNATASDARLMLAQYEELASHIVEWNLTGDDGVPVPATVEGLQTLEVRHANMIAAAWQRAQVDVPGPLPSSSSTTPTTDLSSIRMEDLPESLAS